MSDSRTWKRIVRNHGMGDHKGQEAKEFELDCISAGKQLNALGAKSVLDLSWASRRLT